MSLHRCDVTVMDDWHRTWDKAVADLGGKVAVLVNNAGVNPSHGVRRCLDIMLSGVSDGTFLALDKMSKSKVRLTCVGYRRKIWKNAELLGWRRRSDY
jgi:NAD(P)-dependent dehydrogenase (short-subunit alcohol dehydrogenase family)